MEFLRFGGSIPGQHYGCCAVDIIQNFRVDPDTRYSMQACHGDSGTALGGMYFGPTFRDIFNSRIRIGTFSLKELPCRMYLAAMTANQLQTDIGNKWLAILKENGFEFIRTTHNSVYGDYPAPEGTSTSRPVYLFGLFRNLGPSAIADPFAPPIEWLELPEAKPQQEIWDSGKQTLMTEAEVRKAGAPVMLAGKPGTPPVPKPFEPTVVVQNNRMF